MTKLEEIIVSKHLYRRPKTRSDLPAIDIPLMQPPIHGDVEKADGGIGVSHKMRPLVVHLDRPANTPEGTSFELFWGLGSPAAYNMIREGDEHLTRIPFIVPHDAIQESWADPVYVQVVRGNGQHSQTSPLRLRVNLQHPGGEDLNPEEGNQNLVYELPEDVRLGGVSAERAKQGVEVIVRHWLNMAPYDVLILVWGSVVIERLIQPDEVGRDITCLIDHDAINDAGDSELLPVAFQVRGPTGNTPDPWALWSATSLVPVYLENDRLDAPWVHFPETEREIDLEALSGRDVEIGLTVRAADARVYTHIFLYWDAKNDQGEPVSHFEDRLLSGAKAYYFTIDNDVVRATAKGSAVVYYVLIGAGLPDKRSHNRYLTIIGEVIRWPAPTVDQAVKGYLDPSLPVVTIRFPAQLSWGSTDRLQVTILAGDADGTVDYIAGRLVGQIPPDGQMTFDVAGAELNRFDGRLIEIFYSVSRGNEWPRESQREVYQVGELTRDMPAPQVTKAQGGQLNPDDVVDGADVKAPFAETKAGDWVTLYWYSLVSAPPLRMQVGVNGQVVDFQVLYGYIEPNLNEWVSTFYTLERSGQSKRYSQVTDLLIGRGIGELFVPDLRQASITGPVTATLAPLNAQDGGELVVSYNGMLDGDSIKVIMVGTAGAGSPDIAAKPGNAATGSVSFSIPKTAIAANIGNANRTLTLKYDVTREGAVHSSQVLTVTVTPIPQAELAKTVIQMIEANQTTKELDLSSGTANRTLRVGNWPFIATNSPVWIEFRGFKNGGEAHNRKHWNGGASYVNATWFSQGWWQSGITYASYLKELGHNTKLTLHFKAALGPGIAEADAIIFPQVEYTIRKASMIPEHTHFDDRLDNGWVALGSTLGSHGFGEGYGGGYSKTLACRPGRSAWLEKSYPVNSFVPGRNYSLRVKLKSDVAFSKTVVLSVYHENGARRSSSGSILTTWSTFTLSFQSLSSGSGSARIVIEVYADLFGTTYYIDDIEIF
ncbi:hypothetical protein BW43_03018 [Pseudomonas sp. RIT357]|nr:hypothetical protein BW43_03018 [Pseudomonas sp. RIT357]